MRSFYAYLTTLALFLLFNNAKAQNYAINIPGASYLDCGNNAAFNAPNIKTMECWIKFNSFSTDQEIISRSISGQGIELLIYNGNLAFYCMYNSGNNSSVYVPGSNFSTGVWYHIAATWDGSTKESMAIYVNGIKLSGTVASSGNINSTGLTTPSGTMRIGNWSDASSRYLNATVDEVRIWSVTRTQAQIKAGMYGTVPTSTTGLTAYYNFNESYGTATNPSNTALNGTIVGSITRSASPVQYGDNALTLDGVDDQVIAPAKSTLDLSTGTVQIWAQPTNISTTVHQTLIGVRGTAGSRYSFTIDASHVGFWNSGSYMTINYTFTNNRWYQFTFVMNASSIDVYIFGQLAGTIAEGPGSTTGQALHIGGTEGTSEFFPGRLDEARIWNYAMTATQVSSTWNATLTGSETGLVAWHTFNQGISGGINAGLVTSIDGSATNNNGTLTNFNLSAANSTSNYIVSTTTLPVTYNYFQGSKRNNSVDLTWQTAQERNSNYFAIERSSDNKEFQQIGTVTAAGTTALPSNYQFTDPSPAPGNNYYRLRQIDLDGQAAYSSTVRIDFSANAANGLKIYPNPASSNLNLTLGDAIEGQGALQIIDLSGRTILIRTIQWSTGTNNLSLSIGDLPPGSYLMKITTRGGSKPPSIAPFQIIR